MRLEGLHGVLALPKPPVEADADDVVADPGADGEDLVAALDQAAVELLPPATAARVPAHLRPDGLGPRCLKRQEVLDGPGEVEPEVVEALGKLLT